MMNTDSTDLARECDAGLKMAVEAIDEVMPYIKSQELGKVVKHSKDTHTKLLDECHSLLFENDKETKEPPVMASAMSKMKITTKMITDRTDEEIASILYDGCNMGAKSMYQYLNQYSQAHQPSKILAKKVIAEEESLRHEIQAYL